MDVGIHTYEREYMDDDDGPTDEQTKVYKDGNMLLDLQFCTHIPSYEMVKYYYLFRIVKMLGKKQDYSPCFYVVSGFS